ncbi:MAG: enoyl-CoA hydratase-related protein [Bacillota bacterium]
MAGVSLEINGKVATITLTNPDKLNPLSISVRQEIMEALKESEQQKTHVTIIKGSGRGFSSGYEIDSNKNKDEAYQQSNDILEDKLYLREYFADFMNAVRRHPTPVIAQIHGYCLAGGTDLMLSCDIAIAAEDAKIGTPNTRGLGISIGLLLWPLFMGPMRTKLMAFTGDHITGKQAEEWGIVAMSVPQEKLESLVQGLAERIALVDRDALKVSKMAINESLNILGYQQMIESATSLDAIFHFTPVTQKFQKDARELGLKAALEAKDGPFRGRTFIDLAGLTK